MQNPKCGSTITKINQKVTLNIECILKTNVHCQCQQSWITADNRHLLQHPPRLVKMSTAIQGRDRGKQKFQVSLAHLSDRLKSTTTVTKKEFPQCHDKQSIH